MYIDTHCHLNFEAFESDWQSVIDRAVNAGVETLIVVGTDIASSIRAIELANTSPHVFAAVGIHPHHVPQYQDNQSSLKSDMSQLKRLAREPKVVAIGEIGLDHHQYRVSKYPTLSQDQLNQAYILQQVLFTHQLKLAHQLNLPLIIHGREVHTLVLDVISRSQSELNSSFKGVFHCFEGSKKYAAKIIEAGFHISFTGNLTYSVDRQFVAATIPLERLLLETDAPYMTPVPFRGQRNEPHYIHLIAAVHAQSRGLTQDQIATTTSTNARELFNITL
jgi:TatD DNase family protein